MDLNPLLIVTEIYTGHTISCEMGSENPRTSDFEEALELIIAFYKSRKQSYYRYYVNKGFITGIRPYPNVGRTKEATVQRRTERSEKRSLIMLP